MIEPTSGRGLSVLHQRADSARQAFNRADALVSLAQGCLRGDRPNRSPIEITLTIPDSSLRTDVADPTEAGEMGESFISTEAARRLSCDAGVVEVVEDEQGVPLSVGRKHRYVHEYGYSIELGLDQRPWFRDAHCRLVATVPARPAVADLGWPWIRAINAPIAINAGTIAGPWDGTPVDYGRVVGHLAVADDHR